MGAGVRYSKGDVEMNDLQADTMLTDIWELQAEKLKFQVIADGKIKQIEESLKVKSESIDKEVQFMKDQLAGFFTTCKKKETKTQESYSLLSGKLIMKKATQKIKHDDIKILEWCRQTKSNEFVKEKITKTLDWTKFKANLMINGEVIINSETGEIVENVNGLEIEDVKASFDIK